jgi:hypothetical protein
VGVPVLEFVREFFGGIVCWGWRGPADVCREDSDVRIGAFGLNWNLGLRRRRVVIKAEAVVGGRLFHQDEREEELENSVMLCASPEVSNSGSST